MGATVGRGNTWAYALVAIDVLAMALWTRFWLFDGPGPLTPFDVGRPLFLLPPAIFLLFACLGFTTLTRIGRRQWGRRSAVFLWLSSTLVLMPLAFYAFLGWLLTRDFSAF